MKDNIHCVLIGLFASKQDLVLVQEMDDFPVETRIDVEIPEMRFRFPTIPLGISIPTLELGCSK